MAIHNTPNAVIAILPTRCAPSSPNSDQKKVRTTRAARPISRPSRPEEECPDHHAQPRHVAHQQVRPVGPEERVVLVQAEDGEDDGEPEQEVAAQDDRREPEGESDGGHQQTVSKHPGSRGECRNGARDPRSRPGPGRTPPCRNQATGSPRIQLRVGRLPQQEVRHPPLARGADAEVGVAHQRRVQMAGDVVLGEGGGVDSAGHARRAPRRRSPAAPRS